MALTQAVSNAIESLDASKLTGTLPEGMGEAYISWQSVVTASTLTAVAGRGYPINTTSNACTVTLPATASVGDTIKFIDYARNWGVNAVTLNPNSLNFQGNTSPNPVYNTNGQSVTIIYVDATKGWIPAVDDETTFETSQTYTADFLVIAGGGGTFNSGSVGGGGAGGYRASWNSETSGGGGSSESALTLTKGTQYTVTVGAGGSGSSDSTGGNSVISTITSTGGGRGGAGYSNDVPSHTGDDGGSGGGGGTAQSGSPVCPAGTGTTNQGYAGGTGRHIPGSAEGAGGGGGAGSAGTNSSSGTGGNGGNGVASTITGSSVTRGGGGGGVGNSVGNGGTGGGGDPVYSAGNGNSGTANTGGGGGGLGGSGGSGVGILRMATARYSSTTTGSPTVTTSGSDTILTFTGSGSYTA